MGAFPDRKRGDAAALLGRDQEEISLDVPLRRIGVLPVAAFDKRGERGGENDRAGAKPAHEGSPRGSSPSSASPANDRKGSVTGKSVSARVDLGGRRILQKKQLK